MWSNACIHVVRGRTLDAHGGVAPARAMDLQHAGRPLAANTEPAGDADVSVDDEQLAMIARHEAEPSAKAGRVEDRDVDSGFAQAIEKFSRRAAPADPVEQEANRDAALRRHAAAPPPSVHRPRRSGRCSTSSATAFTARSMRSNHFGEGRGSVAQQRDGDCRSTRRRRRCAKVRGQRTVRGQQAGRHCPAQRLVRVGGCSRCPHPFH